MKIHKYTVTISLQTGDELVFLLDDKDVRYGRPMPELSLNQTTGEPTFIAPYLFIRVKDVVTISIHKNPEYVEPTDE